ncbi:hypothetical protein [Trichormus variabilis]|uniref:Uncharacterized protein n=1 Tax=Trichormus variabilis SAG 1403-4b TaxID=447716 RepID=A0A433UF55_ANAVA|nr:hypothetical protein [Trichormus variabilis]MBD2628490.1 hypothetical protein [Trichormus variabilis FACHB-164]RUS92506.1 hypothetical protein DSM107003_49890 [Trichormus variabilis SAG 1403-4b]
MSNLIRIIQANSEIQYRQTQTTQKLTQASSSGVNGTMGEYDPATGQQKIDLPDGGTIRTTNIASVGVRIGDTVPAVSRTATGQAFMDSRG